MDQFAPAGGEGRPSCDSFIDEVPRSGAQLILEPGQSEEKVAGLLALMKESGMTLCRIRMFEAYMRDGAGEWDFSVFDRAFRIASDLGIRIIGTLFPQTPFEDVGGFKFPRDREHFEAVRAYVQTVVSRFAPYDSCRGWVLINEPGLGQPPEGAFWEEAYEEQFSRVKTAPSAAVSPEMDLSREAFLVDFTSSYLKSLADLVRRCHPDAHIHVNPHDLLGANLGEYDFPAWRPFLSSLGGSAHASWHFQGFPREEYPWAMAATCEILRSGAGELPWLMTEIQGGNNTLSGFTPLCPTGEELVQWLSIVYASGGKGGIFWSFNARSAGREAGEWAMVDYRDLSTDRLRAVGRLNAHVEEQRELYASLRPLDSGVTLIYSRRSVWLEERLSPQRSGEFPGRSSGAGIASLAAHFRALCDRGLQPRICELEEYDFPGEGARGGTAVLPHQIALPEDALPRMEAFVRAGGTLFATGLTGYYDEKGRCRFMNDSLFSSLFGAELREFKALGGSFSLRAGELSLPAHLWAGSLTLAGAEAFAEREGDTAGSIRSLGRGRAVWLPACLGLGAAEEGGRGLRALYARLLPEEDSRLPLRLRRSSEGVFTKICACSGGLWVLLQNKGDSPAELTFAGAGRPGALLFADKGGSLSPEGDVRIRPEETMAVLWEVD